MPASPHPARRRGGVAVPVVAGVLVLALVAGPVVLHFTQRRHNQLPLDIATRFPAEQPLVGGEVFATTLADLVAHELDGGTGWRPNDFVLWGPGLWADNNANRQTGIIQAVRESVRILKDHLTKVSSDEYDANLAAADTAFRNDERKYWFPSAENRLGAGVGRLRAYVDGLGTTPRRSKPINQRNVELIRLFQAWSDQLGDSHAMLFREPAFLASDDEYYLAQGRAHVMAHLVRAVAREYRAELAARPVLRTLVDEVAAALEQAATLKPLIVCNGGPTSLLANHRRNLDTYVTEARQKMYSIREELEK